MRYFNEQKCSSSLNSKKVPTVARVYNVKGQLLIRGERNESKGQRELHLRHGVKQLRTTWPQLHPSLPHQVLVKLWTLQRGDVLSEKFREQKLPKLLWSSVPPVSAATHENPLPLAWVIGLNQATRVPQCYLWFIFGHMERKGPREKRRIKVSVVCAMARLSRALFLSWPQPHSSDRGGEWWTWEHMAPPVGP